MAPTERSRSYRRAMKQKHNAKRSRRDRDSLKRIEGRKQQPRHRMIAEQFDV